MQNFESYFKVIKFLEGLYNLPLASEYTRGPHQNPEIYVKRMRYFLDLIGNPEKGFKFIHITGTSGKGSVANAVHSVLVKSGRNAGLFTSPFVTTSIEKIKVNDKLIAPKDLVEIVENLKPFIDQTYEQGPYGGVSYFEIFTAIAFLYFKKMHCDWVVLEVGLGGRYDSTNVIKNPIITAITNIGYDHTHILGKTLSKIAKDKIGIVKSGSLFFTTEKRPALLKIFKSECTKVGANFNLVPNSKDYLETNNNLVRTISNSIGIKESFINQGIKSARLPCRFEIIKKNPLIILDGAHNESKMESTVSNLAKLKYQKLFLILGMAENKDASSILKILIPKADHVFATRFEIKERKCANPLVLSKITRTIKKIPVETYLDPWTALERAQKLATKKDLILVTGSFFLAGELRTKWHSEIETLTHRSSW